MNADPCLSGSTALHVEVMPDLCNFVWIRIQPFIFLWTEIQIGPRSKKISLYLFSGFKLSRKS